MMKTKPPSVRPTPNNSNIQDSRNSLLVVSYGFPPAGGAGLKRLMKFLKFLPGQGWDCIVLTAKNGNFSIYDRTLSREIDPALPVYRAFTFESLFHKGIENTPTGVGSIVPQEQAVENKSFLKTTGRRVYKAIGSFLKVPDSMILWVPGALNMGISILRKNNIDAIYASGPSFTNFPIAILLKKMFRKPVVLDFRDAWMADPMLVRELKGHLYWAHERLERYVVQNADRVISTNPFVTQYFQERYPSSDPKKYDTVYNGFDDEDHVSLGDSPLEPDFFHVVYTGRLYHERTPKYFLQALQLALLEKPSMRKTLRVTFVGSCEKFMDGKYIEDYLEEYGLKDVVRLTGHVSRKESLSYEMNADLLLVLIGIVPPEMELTYGISGKIFDYLVSGKPILTLSNGGATREFLLQNRIGSIHYHEDVEGIKGYLINLHDNEKGGIANQTLDIRDYQRFNFRSVTAQLVSHLEAIAKR